MDEVKDPLLNERESVSSEGYEYSFITIPERVITIVAAYVQLIWAIKNFRKSISAKKVIQNAKSMFEINQRTMVDVLWKEHCAGSLRELVDGHIAADFPYALRCLPKPTDNDGKVEETYPRLQAYKSILNELAHLNTDIALRKAREISDYNDLENIDREAFDRICTDFIFSLYNLFKDHCMKGD